MSDDAQRRDMTAVFLRTVRTYIEHIRGMIAGGDMWDDPLTDCEAATADLNEMAAAAGRVEEYLIGDLSEQAERWLA
jgi:hypothetical protein